MDVRVGGERIGGLVRVKFRLIGAFMFLGLVLFVTGCAVKGEEQVLITVDPESAVVTLGGTEQFESSPTDVIVTWSVDGIVGGNEGTVGEIDSSGLYTAPTDPAEAPEKVSIEATDPSGTAAAGTATAFLTTFKANERLSTNYNAGSARVNTYSAGEKSIALYKDTTNGNVNVYVVWSDNSADINRSINQVWFTKSTDGGDSFCEQPARIAPFDSADQLSPSIAADSSGNVYVAWEDYRDGDGDIYIARFDGSDCPWDTSPFTSPVKVNSNRDPGPSASTRDSSPAIAIDPDGVIYVVWEDRLNRPENYPNIYFDRSIDGGLNFLINTFIANSGRRPAIAIDSSGTAYVVWEDLTQYPDPDLPTHIMMRKIESGNPGTTKQVDSVEAPDHARFPSVAIGPSGKVYVVWQRAEISDPRFEDEIISAYDIDLATIDGSTLDVSVNPSIPDNENIDLFGGLSYPTIAADDSYIYVAWDDQRNRTQDIYFAKSSDGVTFTTNRIVNIVNDDTGDIIQWHEKPSIAIADNKAYVIWTDYRNAFLDPTGRNNDVFFARE